MSTITNRSGKTLMLWPEQLKERKANNRFDYGNLDELGKSILSNGIIQNLVVRKTSEKTEDDYPIYEVLIGNRRSKAAKKVRDKMIELGHEGDFVPAVLAPAEWTDADIIAASIVTDGQGKERSLLEIAHDIMALISTGMKQKDIAKKIGKSDMYVSDCVLLMEKGTDSLHKQIKNGEVTAYTVIDMLKSSDAGEVDEAVTKSVKKREKETSVKGAGTKKKKPLKKTEIEESHGKPLTQKSKKKEAEAAAPAEPKLDATMAKLKKLKETLKANAGIQKKNSFGVLNAIIAHAKGEATALELMPVFFRDIDEELDAAYVKDAIGTSGKKQKDGAPVAKKGAKSAKPAVADEDEEEEAPVVKKSAKATKPAAKPAKKAAGKKAKVEDDDDDAAYDNDLDADLELDEDDLDD